MSAAAAAAAGAALALTLHRRRTHARAHLPTIIRLTTDERRLPPHRHPPLLRPEAVLRRRCPGWVGLKPGFNSPDAIDEADDERQRRG